MPFQLCGYSKIWNGFYVIYNIYKVLGDLKGIKGFLVFFDELYMLVLKINGALAKNVCILLGSVEIVVME